MQVHSQRPEPHAALQRALVDEFLHRTGHTYCSIHRLPIDQQRSLLRAAAAFATLKLGEMNGHGHSGGKAAIRPDGW